MVDNSEEGCLPSHLNCIKEARCNILETRTQVSFFRIGKYFMYVRLFCLCRTAKLFFMHQNYSYYCHFVCFRKRINTVAELSQTKIKYALLASILSKYMTTQNINVLFK